MTDGWVLAPREPTEAMVDAGYQAMFNHDNVVDIYRAMLAAAPPVDGWQPIETAPRDGTPVLAYWPGEAAMFGVVMWDGDDWRESEYVWRYPTHWMPLPQPPNNERTG